MAPMLTSKNRAPDCHATSPPCTGQIRLQLPVSCGGDRPPPPPEEQQRPPPRPSRAHAPRNLTCRAQSAPWAPPSLNRRRPGEEAGDAQWHGGHGGGGGGCRGRRTPESGPSSASSATPPPPAVGGPIRRRWLRGGGWSSDSDHWGGGAGAGEAPLSQWVSESISFIVPEDNAASCRILFLIQLLSYFISSLVCTWLGKKSIPKQKKCRKIILFRQITIATEFPSQRKNATQLSTL